MHFPIYKHYSVYLTICFEDFLLNMYKQHCVWEIIENLPIRKYDYTFASDGIPMAISFFALCIETTFCWYSFEFPTIGTISLRIYSACLPLFVQSLFYICKQLETNYWGKQQFEFQIPLFIRILYQCRSGNLIEIVDTTYEHVSNEQLHI